MRIYTEDELRKAFRAGQAAGVFLSDFKTDEFEQKYIDAINKFVPAKETFRPIEEIKTDLKDMLIGLQIHLNHFGYITDYDWDYEEIANDYLELEASQKKLVKVYDPLDPKTTVKHAIVDAYNTGYEDRDTNSIKDAEQYYLNKYKPV